MAKKIKENKPVETKCRKMGFEKPIHTLVLKRAFRWTFSFITKENTLTDESFVRSIEMPHLIAGRSARSPRHCCTADRPPISKSHWTPMVVHYYDVAYENNEIWDWMRPYNYGVHIGEETTGSIKFYDGGGNIIEELILHIRPTEVSLSNLDYGVNDESSISIHFDVRSVERYCHNHKKNPQ